MTVYRLVLPFDRPVLTSNEARSRHHWSTQRAAKTVVETAVWALAKKQRIPRLDRCTVMLTWFPPPDWRHRDPDSLGPMVKAVLDGLRFAGVLEDDDGRHVTGVLLRMGEPVKPGRIELVIAAGGLVEGLRELIDSCARSEVCRVEEWMPRSGRQPRVG